MHGIKEDHERWVEQTLGKGLLDTQPPPVNISETVYSTLLSVVELPRFIYGVSCEGVREHEVKPAMAPPRRVATSLTGETEMTPFIVRGGYLYAFQDMNEDGNPFEPFVPGQSAERFRAEEWWDHPDQLRWYVDLLNRSLHKLTGRRGLHFDREHRRYYFPMGEAGHGVDVPYRPLNQASTTRKVVWEPKNRKTGEGRGRWFHQAVSLRFTHYGQGRWCLGIRPELRVTVDGYTPLESAKIGAQITRKKSRMFNPDLLAAVNFWRDFLGDGSPRIIMPFGPKQRIIISTALMSGTITWPGISAEHAKPFANVTYEETLLSWAEATGLGTEDEELEAEDEGQEWQVEGEDEDDDII